MKHRRGKWPGGQEKRLCVGTGFCMGIGKERAGARWDSQPISQDQTLWLEPCSANHEQDWPLLYVYVCMYSHTYSKSMEQPGKVANSACGQLNRENNISLSAFAPGKLVSRDGFGSPVPRPPAYFHTQAESGACLQDSSQVPRRRPFIYL